jgi:hypothetical protein
MSAFLLGWFRLIWLFTRGHQALVLENLALRQQLAVYKRHSKRPRLRRSDRMFWITLAGLWKGWRRVLVLVHQTVTLSRGLKVTYFGAKKQDGNCGDVPVFEPLGKSVKKIERRDGKLELPRARVRRHSMGKGANLAPRYSPI